MSQTATGWLKDKLKETYDKEGKLPLGYTLYLVDQAKQKEKERILHAWENGALPDLLKEYKNSRTYYSETYGE